MAASTATTPIRKINESLIFPSATGYAQLQKKYFFDMNISKLG